MADITKCSGSTLVKCLVCYRNTAKESPHQPYFVEPPAEDGDCKYYWPDYKSSEDSK